MKFETNIKNPNLVEKFVLFLCEELQIRPSTILLASYEVEDSNLGLCIDETESDFIILVKEENRDLGDVYITIAHEMVHVKQYMKENLSWFLHNRSDIPYMERWWEKEAFSMAIPLVEKFAKGLKI